MVFCIVYIYMLLDGDSEPSKVDQRSAAVHIITSWATDQKWVDEFAEDIKSSTNSK